MIALKRSSQVSSLNQDEYIISVLDRSRLMIGSLARKSFAEFDDLYQQAAVIVCEIVKRDGGATRPIGYMRTAIKYRLFDYLFHRPSIKPEISLDLSTGLNRSPFSDIIPEPGPIHRDEARDDRRTEVLYAALHRLHLEEQAHMQKAYGIATFDPWTASDRPANPARAYKDISSGALRKLRSNRDLAAAVLEVRS
jgi:hypothetical protein